MLTALGKTIQALGLMVTAMALIQGLFYSASMNTELGLLLLGSAIFVCGRVLEHRSL